MSPQGRPEADAAAIRAVLVRSLGDGITSVEPSHGFSTEVYRVTLKNETFYLRLAEEPGDDFAIEAEVHRRLHVSGVRVPEIVHYEPVAAEIGRSIMITTAIPGVSLQFCESHDQAQAVIRELGADLAKVNAIAADGFGWVIRDGVPWPPRGEVGGWADWIEFGIRNDFSGLAGFCLDERETKRVAKIVDAELATPCESRLVHGDLDVTPIFYDAGRYTGLIDFGEIRGAEPHYDLAHFRLQDGLVRNVPPLLATLLEGYFGSFARPDDLNERIDRTAVLIAVRQLIRWRRRFGDRAADGFWFKKIVGRTHELLASLG